MTAADPTSCPPEKPFLGLPAGQLSRIDAEAVLLGIPFATVYPGQEPYSAAAPAALRAAISRYSPRLGHHDFELGGSLVESGFGAVVDAGDLVLDESDFPANRRAITGATERILAAGAVPIVIGGDDSVPIPVLQAYERAAPLTILQIDAHIDWRDEVEGERYGLSSNMRRAAEMPWVERIVQVGMRSIGSARRADYQAALDWGVHIVTSRLVCKEGMETVLDLIPEGSNVYVAFDCDGMDSSVMPAVISPTPGGLTYWDLVDMIQGTAARANLLGFNLVEFAPDLDPAGNAALTAARIVLHAAAAAARSG